MLHDPRHEAPYYWASFIVSGDDRSLDLRVRPSGACTFRMGGDAPGGGAAWLAIAAALAARFV